MNKKIITLLVIIVLLSITVFAPATLNNNLSLAEVLNLKSKEIKDAITVKIIAPDKAPAPTGLPTPISIEIATLIPIKTGGYKIDYNIHTFDYSISALNSCYKILQDKKKCIELEQQKIVFQIKQKKLSEERKIRLIQQRATKIPSWQQKDFPDLNVFEKKQTKPIEIKTN